MPCADGQPCPNAARAYYDGGKGRVRTHLRCREHANAYEQERVAAADGSVGPPRTPLQVITCDYL